MFADSPDDVWDFALDGFGRPNENARQIRGEVRHVDLRRVPVERNRPARNRKTSAALLSTNPRSRPAAALLNPGPCVYRSGQLPVSFDVQVCPMPVAARGMGKPSQHAPRC